MQVHSSITDKVQPPNFRFPLAELTRLFSLKYTLIQERRTAKGTT